VEKQQDLGVLFLGFLKLYGQEFNYFRYACHDTRRTTHGQRTLQVLT
jgi:DNA polymerase sigma